MNNKEILKKKIIYRSKHRGSKEMDLLLGSFVDKYINSFDISDLNDLVLLLLVEDQEIYDWYFSKSKKSPIRKSNVSILLKKFKL
jgi:antitoxin CptB